MVHRLDSFFKKQKKQVSKSMAQRMKLYKALKQMGHPVEWKSTSLAQLKSTLSSLRGQQTQKTNLYGLVSKYQLNRIDKRNLSTINALPDRVTFELPVSRFNRIIKGLSAGEDRYLFIHTKDENGSVRKSVSLHNNHFGLDNLFITIDEGSVSDADVQVTDITNGSVEVEWLPKARHQRKRSEFFRYLTHLDYQLEDFQVYDTLMNKDDSNTPCFLFALEQSGMDKDTISLITSSMYSYAVTHDFIRKTAEGFNLHIKLKTYKENSNRFDFTNSSYGNKSLPAINLGCVGQHIFVIKDTKVSSDALKHSEFSSHSDFPSIRVKNGRVVKNGNPKCLMSHQVIGQLYFNRKSMLTPITLDNAPNLLNNKYDEIDSLSSVSLDKKWFKRIGLVKEEVDDQVFIEGYKYGAHPFTTRLEGKTVEEDFSVVYFDLETFPNEDNEHIPYCSAWKIDDKPTNYAFGLDCVDRMLNALPNNGNYLMFAHNAGFDIRFLIRHLTSFDTRMGVIESGNCMKQLVAMYKGSKIVCKDTMSFLAGSLAGLPNQFPGACDSINLEKESFPHDMMNANTFNSLMPLDLVKSQFHDYENLVKNAANIDAIIENKLDITKYAIHYCKRDVDVLAICFERFRDMFITRFKQDVYRHISMPGLAYAILNNDGCYDDCYSMSGPCLSFVRKAIIGGRVMTRDNKKWHTNHEISDFDAVSLYPSAMARLPGFAKGKPRLHLKAIPKCDYHISKVKILSISKKLHFPLQSIKVDNESRDFTNDIVGKEIILDQYALEDLVHYQGATYEVIEGLCWDSGFNKNIVGGITRLFEERLKLKAQGNPLQNGIKLLMNASYGKLIQKPIVKSKTIIRGVKAIDDYTVKRINRLIQRTPIAKDIAIFEEHKPLSQHFSPAHLGVQILSMSKRIMNEVMCLAEERELNIWYQDTDSMHIDCNSLTDLTESFKKRYGRNLVGKGLGQFHSDFELEGSSGEVYAIESYFIGKKTYVDFLKCAGNDITGVHKRMKGIPSKLIVDPRATYDGLFNGKDQIFDMELACPIKINNRTQKVSKRTAFQRIVKAPTH